jgi:nucleoside 2-deoxyribosyltransferase
LSHPNPERPLRRVAKVYVAGSSAELERCEAAIARLERAGVHVTSTWPIVVRDAGAGNPRDASRDRRRLLSVSDLGQVRDADLVWVLVPPLDCPTRGAWLEAGYAHGLGKLVVFSGDTLQSIFCATGTEFTDDAHAFDFLMRICDAVVQEAARG